jgi:hypothetical protein
LTGVVKLNLNINRYDANISSSSNNFLDDNDFNEYFKNNEENKGNEAVFSLHDTPTGYLF